LLRSALGRDVTYPSKIGPIGCPETSVNDYQFT